MAKADTINSSILGWAREAAGLSLDEAAEKIGLTSSEKTSAADKLSAMERGDASPTRNQLLKIAKVYRRPLLTFYLDSPPTPGGRGQDFRTLAAPTSPRDSGVLDALLRDIHARQQIVRSILEDDDETKPLEFVASATMERGVAGLVASLRQVIGVGHKDQLGVHSPEELFSILRRGAERAGVFVLMVGDLGSHHSAIDEKVFRGFAIADPIAPFAIINPNDAMSAQSFTLIHELAHIWLGATGISGGLTLEGTTAQNRIEYFCNEVAGEFLVPSSEVAALSRTSLATAEQVLQITQTVSQRWHVSQAMVTVKLSLNGLITPAVATEVASVLSARWVALRSSQRAKSRDSEGGPDYYVVKRSRLGAALIGVVEHAVRAELLSHTKAAKVLGVGVSGVESLFRSGKKAAG